MAGLGRKVFTRERLTVADTQGYLMDQTRMVFASAAARAVQVPSPSEGMESWLLDLDRPEDFVYGAWRPRTGSYFASFIGGQGTTLNATNNVDLASIICAPGRPYEAQVTVNGEFTCPSGSAGRLRLWDSGVVDRGRALINPSVQDGHFTRTFTVLDGVAHTYKANLEVYAGGVTYYTDERYSFLEVKWTAL